MQGLQLRASLFLSITLDSRIHTFDEQPQNKYSKHGSTDCDRLFEMCREGDLVSNLKVC